MPIKGSGATEPREIDRFDDGVGWLAYPREGMQRASHALATDAGVLLVDPVDAEGVDELYADLGDVVGVVQLLDRHERDAVAFATRHDVPIYTPEGISGPPTGDVRAGGLGNLLVDTAYTAERVPGTLWTEVALVDQAGGTLVVPEALGTADFFRAGDEPLGIHPLVRLTPPRLLREFDVERVLVGHGEGVLTDGSAAVRDAVDNARRRAPAAYLGALTEFVS